MATRKHRLRLPRSGDYRRSSGSPGDRLGQIAEQLPFDISMDIKSVVFDLRMAELRSRELEQQVGWLSDDLTTARLRSEELTEELNSTQSQLADVEEEYSAAFITTKRVAGPVAKAMRDGQRLAEQLNASRPERISFAEATQLGVDLVHHPDSIGYTEVFEYEAFNYPRRHAEQQRFHTATGDVVSFNIERSEWESIASEAKGILVRSGTMQRLHRPGANGDGSMWMDATIHPTATVEDRARLGAGVVVERHAHIGSHASIGPGTRIKAGTFVGASASIGADSRIGPGAVVGSGSDIGSNTNVGAGARIEQSVTVGHQQNIAAHSTVTLTSASVPADSTSRNTTNVVDLEQHRAATGNGGVER